MKTERRDKLSVLKDSEDNGDDERHEHETKDDCRYSSHMQKKRNRGVMVLPLKGLPEMEGMSTAIDFLPSSTVKVLGRKPTTTVMLMLKLLSLRRLLTASETNCWPF